MVCTFNNALAELAVAVRKRTARPDVSGQDYERQPGQVGGRFQSFGP